MENSEQKMTPDGFELAVVAYGPDMAAWPEGLQHLAKVFIATDEGKRVHDNSRMLDQHMTHAKANLSLDKDTKAFMANLAAIPAQFEQQHVPPVAMTAAGESGWRLGALLDRLLEPARLWSPVGLVSQGACAAALLFAGVMVGVNAAGSESFEDYDISAGLFDVSEQDYSIDG